MPKSYTTSHERAARTLICCGKSLAVLPMLSPEEIDQLAALSDEQGNLVAGDSTERCRVLLAEFYERRKAADADHDAPDVAAQQKAVEDAAANLRGARRPEAKPKKANRKEG